jgi:hypothetical protein
MGPVTISKAGTKWFVPVEIFPKELPVFESHQQRWLDNNRAYLESVKGKNPVRVEALPQVAEQGPISGIPDSHRLTYEFNMLKQSPANWKLVYITPARIVEFVVPFEFKDLKLP